MRQLALAIATITVVATISAIAHADMVVQRLLAMSAVGGRADINGRQSDVCF
jgi:hypothetical protein